ncbi:hypothetical protein AGMMS49574_07030 [Bacteroidia bacterium]|nr:hypothetical protein AGMMS49574_07030 [Bacteroidia bacterium]
MIVKRFRAQSIILLGLSVFTFSGAQNTATIPESVSVQMQNTDTVTTSVIAPKDSDLDQIVDMRSQLQKQNATYSRPAPINDRLLRFFKEDKLNMSDEALYWVNYVRDPSTRFSPYMTFRDTLIVDPLYMPFVFKGDILPKNLTLYDKNRYKPHFKFTPWYQTDTTLFQKELMRMEVEDMAKKYVEKNNMATVRYSKRDLPQDVIKVIPIRTPVYEEVPLAVTSSVNVDDVEAPAKFIPDRLYWRSGFESAIQFSQNYVSPNWHKGGSSNLNIFTKNNLKYDYNRDRVQFTNELEIKASIYNAPNDTLHNYKIGDDLFRIHSNFGYKAFEKWYYTVDAEFKTQMFSNYQENTETKQAALLSPFAFNIGVGMKYDLEKKFKARHKKLTLSTNLAPISFTYMKSIDKDIDLGRHGFKKKEGTNEYNSSLSRLGSTFRADMTMTFNRNVSWQSRFYYFTTYEFTQFEFENTLVLAITRYFSTRIYAHLRYDDSVTKKEDFNSYFQLNELLSFGFNYKW